MNISILLLSRLEKDYDSIVTFVNSKFRCQKISVAILQRLSKLGAVTFFVRKEKEFVAFLLSFPIRTYDVSIDKYLSVSCSGYFCTSIKGLGKEIINKAYAYGRGHFIFDHHYISNRRITPHLTHWWYIPINNIRCKEIGLKERNQPIQDKNITIRRASLTDYNLFINNQKGYSYCWNPSGEEFKKSLQCFDVMIINETGMGFYLPCDFEVGATRRICRAYRLIYFVGSIDIILLGSSIIANSYDALCGYGWEQYIEEVGGTIQDKAYSTTDGHLPLI